jgi:hypothetical protein
MFMGMLSIKGTGDLIMLDSYKLHRRFHMDHALVLDALKVLSSPDTKRAGQPHEGRRIAPVEGGWLILNGKEYRDKARLIMKRARDARAQANARVRKAGKPEPYPKAKRVRVSAEEEMAAHAEVQSTQIKAHEAMQYLNEIQAAMPEPELPRVEGGQ